ncbi:solute carrier family 22 member 13-like, partial [Scleropages formosus]
DSTCMEAGEPFTYGQTMFMIGLLIGSLFGGALADKYGKRVVHLGSNILQAVTALMTAFLPSAAFYLAARWIAGLTCCGINITSFSLGTVPHCCVWYRTWPPALLSFSFSVGMMFLAAVAFLTSGWMQFHLAMAVPQLLCLPFYYSIPESPQWLLLNRRLEVLEEYRNRCPEDKESLDLILNSMGKEAQGSSRAEGKSEKHSFLLLFRSPTILLRLSVMSYIGLASALTYYGICYNVGSFGVNIYLAQFFSGLSEVPTLLVPLLLKRCGRRPFSMVSLLLSGTACLLSLLASKYYDIPALVMTLALMGKLCMQTTVFVSLLYGIELFPTVIRQKCVAFVNLWYRIGCILNAVLVPSGRIPLGAMICYSSGPILGAGLCRLLPETSGTPLPDTILDCEMQPGPRLKCTTCNW